MRLNICSPYGRLAHLPRNTSQFDVALGHLSSPTASQSGTVERAAIERTTFIRVPQMVCQLLLVPMLCCGAPSSSHPTLFGGGFRHAVTGSIGGTADSQPPPADTSLCPSPELSIVSARSGTSPQSSSPQPQRDSTRISRQDVPSTPTKQPSGNPVSSPSITPPPPQDQEGVDTRHEGQSRTSSIALDSAVVTPALLGVSQSSPSGVGVEDLLQQMAKVKHQSMLLLPVLFFFLFFSVVAWV